MPSYAHRLTEEGLSLGKRHQREGEMEESVTTVLVGGGEFWIREGGYIFHSIAEVNGRTARFFSCLSFFLEEPYVGTE